MKTFLTTLFCFAVTLTIFAQDNTDTTGHLKFKGVPIDGTLNEYVSKMKQSGFTLIQTEDGFAMLKGDFAAYKDCYLGVATLTGQDLVNKVSVIFPNCETWTTLSTNYFNLKELLTEKYGEPSQVVERFNSNIEPDSNGSKMHEVGLNNCTYFTTFQLENGSIELSIQHEGFALSFVMLSYFDKTNSERVRQKAIDDL